MTTYHVISGKQWFKIANKLRKQQSIHTIPTLIDGESEASTNEDKATLLNSNFCSQSSIDDSNHHLPNIPTTDCSISEIDISVQDVKDAINLIDAYTDSGPDLISPKLICECSDILAGPLSTYFNRLLMDSEFPSSWKFHHFIKNQILQSCLGKLMERCIHKLYCHQSFHISISIWIHERWFYC